MDRLGKIAEQTGAYDTLVIWTDTLKKDVWAARSAFLTVIEAQSKLLDEMDVVVPVDKIAPFLEEDEFKKRVKKLMDASYAKCAEFGGQVSGEHAIGHAKKQYLRESVGETVYGLMTQIKTVFDPDAILNPGKVCHDLEGGAESC